MSASSASTHKPVISTRSSLDQHHLPRLNSGGNTGFFKPLQLSPSSSLGSLESFSNFSRNSERIHGLITHQKIIKTVGEWFQTWRSWQQKILLCGMTNRCSVSQLESLATTLEPVFHRDFVTSMSKHYPTKLIKIARQKKSTHENEGVNFSVLSSFNDKENLEKQLVYKASEADTHYISATADKLVQKAFHDALIIVSDSLGCSEQGETVQLSCTKSEPIDDMDQQEVSSLHLSSLPKASFAETLELLLLGRDVDRREASQHHNAWSSHHTAPVPCLTPLFSNADQKWSSSAHSKRIGMSPVKSSESRLGMLIHRHRRGTTSSLGRVKSVDYFTSGNVLGPAQVGLRTGRVHRPPAVADVNIPIQRLYKNAKWFPSDASGDKRYLKPHHSSLTRHYQQQLNQVWLWISKWQDYESLALLVDIVKLCDQNMTTYLAQCLYYRLQERVDINWLPDQVLLIVLSNLSLDDIISCQQVCRRWKYLCSVDQLWQFKCQEFGYEHGIADLQGLIHKANDGRGAIDWQLAFLELHRLTEQVLRTVRCPSELRMKGTMSPAKVLRRNHGLIYPPAPEETKSVVFKPCPRVSNDPPRLSLAASLAQQSARLKHGLNSGVVGIIPKLSDERTSLESAAGVSWSASNKTKSKSSKTLSDTDAVATDERTVAQSGENSSLDSLRKSSSLDLDRTEVTSATSNNKPLLRLTRGRKRLDEDSEERAVDVRMTLTQSQDLLHISKPDSELLWKAQSSANIGRKTKFGGQIRPVQRVRKLLGHMDGVLCIDVDKRRLISGSMDRSIRIWDINTGNSIHKFYGHKGSVSCLRIANNMLFSGSWDMTIMVWDLIKFSRKAKLTGHTGSVSCIELANSIMISGAHDATVRVWCVKELTCLFVINSHRSHVLCMQCDDKYIYSGSSDKTIHISDIETGSLVKVLSGSRHPIHRLIVRGKLAISCNERGQVCFWDLSIGELQAMIQAHTSPINALAFYQGHFFTASSDQTVKEWDLITMTCVRSLVGHKTQVNDIKVNDKHVVSCSGDGHIRAWDFKLPFTGLTDSLDDVIHHSILLEKDMENL